MNLSSILQGAGEMSNVLLFFVSLKAYRKGTPIYIKAFAVLCLLELVADIALRITDTLSGDLAINNLLILTELIFYTYILCRIVHSRVIRLIVYGLTAAFTIRYGLEFLKHGIGSPVGNGYDVYSGCILLIPCFTYFREIFTYDYDGELIKDATFWIVAGTLFFCGAAILFEICITYLYFMDHNQINAGIRTVVGFMFLCVNILYIKAFLCLRH
jgi:hypothetical protein